MCVFECMQSHPYVCMSARDIHGCLQCAHVLLPSICKQQVAQCQAEGQVRHKTIQQGAATQGPNQPSLPPSSSLPLSLSLSRSCLYCYIYMLYPRGDLSELRTNTIGLLEPCLLFMPVPLITYCSISQASFILAGPSTARHLHITPPYPLRLL